jgi:chromate reductase
MTQPALLGICGSLRAASTNLMALQEARRLFGPATWALGNLRLPLYDADLEAATGLPPEVQALADQIQAADAIIISTPEYNKNLPGVLKNALDWTSRAKGAVWKGNPVAILSASSGRAGGERSQYSLRHCLTPLFPSVLPGPEVTIAASSKAFDDNGHLKDEFTVKILTELMQALRATL